MSSLIAASLSGLIVIIVGLVAYAVWVAPIFAKARKAESESESKLKEAFLAAKEEGLRYREKVEEELRDREKEVVRREEKVRAGEEDLEVARKAAVAQSEQFAKRDEALRSREGELIAQLAGVAKLTREEAEEHLMARVEAEQRDAVARRAREVEAEATATADRRAKSILLDAMQRCAVEYVSEATVSMVPIPSEDMKGRIIGREGRNIRSFEQITGVDLIIDETPDAVVVSCFDPVRREIARITLANLIEDGRIHPVRIEELFAKAQAEVQQSIVEAGRQAVETAAVGPMSSVLTEMLGRLRFRTSYAQNVLDHSVEVSRLAGLMAAELGLDVEFAKRAGLLHDVGKALAGEHDGPHALVGKDFLTAEGETMALALAVGSHHAELQAERPEAVLISIADSISACRPGARKENLENYVKRLTALEALASGFPGVDHTYAVQAGREIRIIVKPTEVDDEGASRLAADVARRIEKELEFPGQIKVTVIRETRVQEVAK